MGAAEAIRDHFNIEIWGSQKEDRFLFESLPQQSQQFGLPYISAFTPDRWFNQEGEKIQIGTFTFEILHLPGHTPGHIGFIEHEKISPLLEMCFSTTALGVQTSLVGIVIH